MSVTCDFLTHNLTCILPENTMDILLKVRTKSGEYTFREDVYMRTLKYRRWNNELMPFRSLKRRVANIFRKRNSFSDSSRGTSMQTIVNNLSEQCKAETREKDSETDSDSKSVHSNWSELIPTNSEVNNTSTTDTEIKKSEPQIRKKAIKNIVLVPYKPKPKDWGSWKVKYPYATSIIASPPVNNQDQNNEEMSHIVHITLQFNHRRFTRMSEIFIIIAYLYMFKI